MADTTVRLGPGEAQSFPMAVHYHRVVGAARTGVESAEGLEVLIVDTATWREHGDQVPSEDAVYVASGEDVRVVNHLIRCCDDGYADYRLIVRNGGSMMHVVDLRAWAVHDDFAVVVDRAEPGAFGVPATIFGALSVLGLVVAGRRRNRRPELSSGLAFASGESRSRSGRPRRSDAARWSIAIAAIALAVAAGLGIAGALRYATDPVTGMMSILADLPLPGGPFGSRAALLMGILLLAWCGAIAAWIRAMAVGGAGKVQAVGIALGGISLVGGVAMGIAYDALAVPGVLGLILGVPLIVASWLAASDETRGDDVSPEGA